MTEINLLDFFRAGNLAESESYKGVKMVVYTYSEARQKLAQLLDEVLKEGEVRIKRKDGQEFVVKSVSKKASPLDVPGIDLGIDAVEIVQFLHEGRRYNQ